MGHLCPVSVQGGKGCLGGLVQYLEQGLGGILHGLGFVFGNVLRDVCFGRGMENRGQTTVFP